MQLEAKLGVQADGRPVRLAYGQCGDAVWIRKDPLHQVSPHTTVLPAWCYRQPYHVYDPGSVIGERVAYQFLSEFDHPPGTAAQFVAHGVVTHPVLVEETFFETTDGRRVTRQRFTEFVVHGSQG